MTQYTLLKDFTLPFPQPSVPLDPDVQYIGKDGMSWDAFQHLVKKERDSLATGEDLKVLFLLRHGHCEHNDMPLYPMPHWSRLKGRYDANTIDPALSQIGAEQISHLAIKLQSELAPGPGTKGVLPPSKIYTSITKRTCQTAVEAWRPVLGQHVPIIAMQDLRDTLCGQGFSRRGPLSEIKRLFPGIQIQKGTTETDELWEKKGGHETWPEVGDRVVHAFNEIWLESKTESSIGIIAHKDIFNALWTRVLGVEAKDFQTAEMRVVIIKRSLEGQSNL